MSGRTEAMARALLAERAGYIARGLHDRVALVDEQLAALGVAPPVAPPGSPETTMAGGGPERAVRPRGRPRKAG